MSSQPDVLSTLDRRVGVDNLDLIVTIGYSKPLATRINRYATEPERDTMVVNPHQVLMRDMRTAGELDMEVVGFGHFKHSSTLDIHESVYRANHIADPVATMRGAPSGDTKTYLSEVADFIKAQTGARDVLPVVSGVLSRSSKRGEATVKFFQPVGFVHMDYAPEQAERELVRAFEVAGRTIEPYSRFVLYQTWRALTSAPQDYTLAICDGSSGTADDHGPFAYTILGPEDNPHKVVESPLPKFSPNHRWYYMSDLTPEDLLVFIGYDSNAPEAMHGMHTGFENPMAGPDAEPRRSIETRFVALFD